jgi:hypothetical protein
MAMRVIFGLLLLGGAVGAQDAKAGPQAGVDQKRIDEAIQRGVAYLKTQERVFSSDPQGAHAPELVLWTFVHAGLRDGDAAFDALFKTMLGEPLKSTYRVSLQAMILEEIQRVTYQKQIFRCAQFLIDNQCRNGQWAYGEPTSYPEPAADGVATGGPRPVVTGEFGSPASEAKPRVIRRLVVKRQRDGPETGDNSNSQYAALGLRACQDAGVVLPREALQRARTWWRDSQHVEDERAKEIRSAVPTGTGAVIGSPAGWCYGSRTHGHKAYGSMTAGAVGSLVIYGHLLGERNPGREPAVLRGLQWLAREFTVTGNPGPSEHVPDSGWMSYYFLYALERAGILCGVDKLGTHSWYVEGAAALIRDQKPDGSWLSPHPHGDRSRELNSVWDTCFAILFLKRATRPLQDVASTDRHYPGK